MPIFGLQLAESLAYHISKSEPKKPDDIGSQETKFVTSRPFRILLVGLITGVAM
jgi:hypothetical protein